MSSPRALVSIVIPAYNEAHFPQAFASALAQTHAPVEIVVCDDSPGEAIEATVARAADARVRYMRNPRRLGFGANFTQCFSLARGELIKFLNDDDRLRPRCVEVLGEALAGNPGLALATSRRVMIDAAGHPLADTAATTPLSHVSAWMPGDELGNFVLVNSVNLIGEPTTVMFRRSAVDLEDGALFRWGGRDYHCLADLSLWIRLLAKGGAYYASAALSEYRVHAGQEQRQEGSRLSCLTERLCLVRQARQAGFLGTPAMARAALENARKIAAAWLQRGAPSASEREAVTALLAEFDQEIGAL